MKLFDRIAAAAPATDEPTVFEGRRVDESNPMADVRLADGSRVNAVLPPIAPHGPMLTIRRSAPARLDIVVSGAAGAGRTTLLAGAELPQHVMREQTASAIDLIAHVTRLCDGTRRITRITEVTGMAADVITRQDLYTFDHAIGVDEDGNHRGTLRATGVRPLIVQKLAEAGVALPAGVLRELS